MFLISKIAKSILGPSEEMATEEVRRTELHQEKAESDFAQFVGQPGKNTVVFLPSLVVSMIKPVFLRL